MWVWWPVEDIPLMRVAREEFLFNGVYCIFFCQFKRLFINSVNEKWDIMWEH